jgi:hypothetical protein
MHNYDLLLRTYQGGDNHVLTFFSSAALGGISQLEVEELCVQFIEEKKVAHST